MTIIFLSRIIEKGKREWIDRVRRSDEDVFYILKKTGCIDLIALIKSIMLIAENENGWLFIPTQSRYCFFRCLGG